MYACACVYVCMHYCLACLFKTHTAAPFSEHGSTHLFRFFYNVIRSITYSYLYHY